MSLIHSFFSAFLMYTRIPMPQVEWREENRRYSLCFFPLCGAVIGGLLLLWRWLCTRLGAGELLFASVGVALPVLVTGGIHMDGYLDTCDAMSSWREKARWWPRPSVEERRTPFRKSFPSTILIWENRWPMSLTWIPPTAACPVCRFPTGNVRALSGSCTRPRMPVVAEFQGFNYLCSS